MAKDKGKPSKEELKKMVEESFKRNKREDDHDTREAEKRLRKAIEDEKDD